MVAVSGSETAGGNYLHMAVRSPTQGSVSMIKNQTVDVMVTAKNLVGRVLIKVAVIKPPGG